MELIEYYYNNKSNEKGYMKYEFGKSVDEKVYTFTITGNSHLMYQYSKKEALFLKF